MSLQQSHPDERSGQAAGVDSAAGQSRQREASSLEYDILVRRYQEAVVRICELEAQIDRLESRLREGRIGDPANPEAAPRGQASGAAGLVARIEALESKVSGSASGERPPSAVGDADRASTSRSAPSSGQRSDEMTQLRLQVANLAGQLARAEEQLNDVKQTRVRRRRSSKSHRSRWWRFWQRSRRR